MTVPIKILVAGAAGQLGKAMVARLARDHEVIPCTRAEVDLTAQAATLDFIRRVRPQVIVNCASYNDVDAAERN